MSYYVGKNLKMDKKNNKISCELADSCWRDFEDKLIFEKVDDLYNNLNKLEDKKSNLYYDVICGNLHLSGKYSDLICSFDYFENFVNEFRDVLNNDNRKDLDLYNVFLKYKKDIDRYTIKNCILRQKEYDNRYITKTNKNSVFIGYYKTNAKKFNDIQVKKNDWYIDNFEIEYI